MMLSLRKTRACLRALHREDGFSLTELMVVLVIIGILTLIALPRFMNMTTRAKTTEARMMLRNVHTLMQAYFFEQDHYTTDLALIGFEQTPTVEDGGSARYVISIEAADGAQFTSVATAVVDFDKDGQFNVWQINQDALLVERTPD